MSGATTGRIKAAWYAPTNYVAGTEQRHESQSKRYILDLVQYATGGDGWNVSLGKVYRRAPGEPYLLELLAEVKRNYPEFPFAWLERHGGTAERNYLLCSEDYWGGVTAIDLRTRQIATWAPADTKERWCWATLTPSPDGTLVAVEGCYWASGYDVRVYDTSQPLALPYPVRYDTGSAPAFTTQYEGYQDMQGDPFVLGWAAAPAQVLRLGVTRFDEQTREPMLRPGMTEEDDDCYEIIEYRLDLGAPAPRAERVTPR